MVSARDISPYLKIINFKLTIGTYVYTFLGLLYNNGFHWTYANVFILILLHTKSSVLCSYPEYNHSYSDIPHASLYHIHSIYPTIKLCHGPLLVLRLLLLLQIKHTYEKNQS